MTFHLFIFYFYFLEKDIDFANYAQHVISIAPSSKKKGKNPPLPPQPW